MNWRTVFAAILCLALWGCAGPRTAGMVDGSKGLPAPSSTERWALQSAPYRLGTHDLLEISVFGVPELSREVRVNSDGQIALPLIGSVLASGKTLVELQDLIGERLAETYLQDPQVSVFVREYVSQRVTLEGAVNKPGIYPLTSDTTLLQAMAMAGGLTDLAQTDGVVVFREVDGRRMAAVFDVGDIRTGQAGDPRVYGDDIIVVAKSGGKSALQELIRSTPVLTLFFLL